MWRFSLRRSVGLALSAGAAVACGLAVRACVSPEVETGGGGAAVVVAAAGGSVTPSGQGQPAEPPTFARPEEARRYFEAKIFGNREAIALLDQAIAEVRARGDSDVRNLDRLKRERESRLIDLKVQESALRDLPGEVVAP